MHSYQSRGSRWWMSLNLWLIPINCSVLVMISPKIQLSLFQVDQTICDGLNLTCFIKTSSLWSWLLVVSYGVKCWCTKSCCWRRGVRLTGARIWLNVGCGQSTTSLSGSLRSWMLLPCHACLCPEWHLLSMKDACNIGMIPKNIKHMKSLIIFCLACTFC